MAFLDWLKRLGARGTARPPQPAPPEKSGAIPLPAEPFVFECRDCHKVFDARRLHPSCPECDSSDVELVSE